MENFPPQSSITVIVKFTKTLYAQLINQRFHPPKIFKPAPPTNSEKYKSFDLGGFCYANDYFDDCSR